MEFPFKIVEHIDDKCVKWIVRKENIDYTKKTFYWISSFKDDATWSLGGIQHLLKTTKDNHASSDFLPTDNIRNITIKEYNRLGEIFKNQNVKFNKKTNKIQPIINK